MYNGIPVMGLAQTLITSISLSIQRKSTRLTSTNPLYITIYLPNITQYNIFYLLYYIYFSIILTV